MYIWMGCVLMVQNHTSEYFLVCETYVTSVTCLFSLCVDMPKCGTKVWASHLSNVPLSTWLMLQGSEQLVTVSQTWTKISQRLCSMMVHAMAHIIFRKPFQFCKDLVTGLVAREQRTLWLIRFEFHKIVMEWLGKWF